MPKSLSLRRPVSVIQSLDQAGASRVTTSASLSPAAASAASTASRMASVAGQPV
jgi:hypothetical protein